MELYKVIKNDGPGDVLAWKFLGEDFNSGSQLIVAESEEALFYKDGIIEQTFDGGKYTLSTNNYPFISRFRNFFSKGVSSFNCKVYFINKVHKLELLWGTDTPIQMRDPVYMLQTSIQARGSYSIQIADSKKFLLKLMGNNIQYFTKEELNSYFRSAFLQYIKDEIPKVIKRSGREILDICTEKTTISDSLIPVLKDVLDEYGIRLVNFYISAIDIPDNDPNRGKLEEAYANRAVMGVLGENWAKQQSADILKDLANNQGSGGVAAAGAGLGMGMFAGSAFGEMAGQMFGQVPSQPSQQVPPQQPIQTESPTQSTVQSNEIKCPTCHANNSQASKFCNECGTKLVIDKVLCHACQSELPENAKFCNECGTRRV